jgi:hypothetical protein
MGEVKVVEGSRFAPLGGMWSPECHQAGLVRLDRQTVLPEALREHIAHLLRVLAVLKAHDHVVREARQERTPSQSWGHLLREP